MEQIYGGRLLRLLQSVLVEVLVLLVLVLVVEVVVVSAPLPKEIARLRLARKSPLSTHLRS